MDFRPHRLAVAAFSGAQLDQIFPFHFAIDRTLRLVSMGRALRKLLPRAEPGSSLAEHFSILSPRLPLTYEALQKAAAALVILKGRGGAPVLNGEFVDLAESLLFVGVPAVDSLRTAQELGLNITDFPHHAAATDLLLLLQTQKLMNDDLQRLARDNAREIEQRVFAEQELQRAVLETRTALRGQARFLNTLSHEIRTPLHAISGSLSVLEELVGQVDQATEMVVMARNASESLQRLLGDILEFADLDAGRFGLEYGAFELEALLQRVRSVMAPAARARGVQLELLGAENLPAVALLGDPKRIQQVLLSLVEHAIEFTRRGSVTLCASATRSAHAAEHVWHLRFDIEDFGGSVPTERLGHLVCGAGADGAEVAGTTGLELEVARQLATMMGGEVTLQHVGDRGNRIHFELELGEERSAPRSAPSPAATALPATALHVLVVDDVAVNRKLFRCILERAGYQVDECSDGDAALAAVTSGEYDLVLMDVSMPGMDGLATTRAIRERGQRVSAVPIIAVTAHALRGDREACLAAGMNDYLSKPVASAKLLEMVAAWTAGSPRSVEETRT